MSVCWLQRNVCNVESIEWQLGRFEGSIATKSDPNLEISVSASHFAWIPTMHSFFVTFGEGLLHTPCFSLGNRVHTDLAHHQMRKCPSLWKLISYGQKWNEKYNWDYMLWRAPHVSKFVSWIVFHDIMFFRILCRQCYQKGQTWIWVCE